MSVYLDACVLVPLFVEEAKSAAVRRFIDDKADLVISAFGVGEFSAALSRHVRMGEVSAERATDRISVFDVWLASDVSVVALDDTIVPDAIALVRQFALKLLMPDAIHLALCMRNGLSLATLDDRLAVAARGIGLEVVVPG